jgi:hypothetical protein
MPVGLNQKVLEATLIQMSMTHSPMTLVVLPHMRVAEPLHIDRKINTSEGPQYQMPVVAHDAKGQEAHRNPLVRLGEQQEEMLVIP